MHIAIRFACRAFLRNRGIAALSWLLATSHSLSAATSCENLSQISLEHTQVASAQQVAAGAFLPPGVDATKPEANAYKKLPAFCRVVLHTKMAPGSDIPTEVWLPLEHWNEKFRGQGNGGFAGSFDYRGMASSLGLNYATASTDTGHTGEGEESSWALEHPQKVIDFGYRAVHVMTENAKAVIAAFYAQPLSHAYFDSCSDGGREALMEAQRFPGDYEGILAGAPANDWTHLLTASLAVQQIVLKDEASYIPLEKIPAINSAVLQACDALDGVKDGIISARERCHFDPLVLLCSGTPNESCLTSAQVRSLLAIYAGGKDSSGKQIFPPIMPGGEAGEGGWKYWLIGDARGAAPGNRYPIGFFTNMVFDDPKWDYRKANVDAALRVADSKLARVLNSTDPDLTPFKQRGGKLILYHGWLDAAISPLNTIHYYQSVVAKMGQPVVDQFVRLYMVPGMQHCAGGPGPFIFGQLGIARSRDPEQNVFTALERWVETGKSPGPIVASKLNDDRDPEKGVRMTRPLCPYPQTDVYSGTGDTNQASSFSCRSPKL